MLHMTGYRKLDAFIAERVMGWHASETGKWWDDSEGDHVARRLEGITMPCSPWSPSSDIAACALLKAKLREKGIGFSINYGFPVGKVGVLEAGGSGFESADTEEMAVALFAKALVEAGVLE